MRGAAPASAFRARVRPWTALSLVLLALAGALALTACGREEKLTRAEYERELQETNREVETTFAGVGSELRNVSVGSATLDRAVERVETARERLEEQADELGEMTPPDDADEAHDELVQGIEELADELRAFTEAVESGDVRRLQQFVTGLNDLEAVRKIEAATRKLESRGYDVRP